MPSPPALGAVSVTKNAGFTSFNTRSSDTSLLSWTRSSLPGCELTRFKTARQARRPPLRCRRCLRSQICLLSSERRLSPASVHGLTSFTHVSQVLYGDEPPNSPFDFSLAERRRAMEKKRQHLISEDAQEAEHSVEAARHGGGGAAT